jgi:excisionase family DNA binding protein
VFDDKFIDELAKALASRVIACLPTPQPGIAPRYLDIKQAAAYLSTTPHAIRRMLRDKHFPCRKIGSRTFIDKQDIDEAMAKNLHYLN